MVVAPGVSWSERATLAVVRLRPDEALLTGVGQRMDGGVEALPRERLGLALARPEAGTPEEPFGLLGAEASFVNRYAGSGAQRKPPPTGSARAPKAFRSC
jgi:hypothetical protein